VARLSSVSGDGQTIVSCDFNNRFRVWDQQGASYHEVALANRCLDIATTKDGLKVAHVTASSSTVHYSTRVSTSSPFTASSAFNSPFQPKRVSLS
jgi:hypothetical protein